MPKKERKELSTDLPDCIRECHRLYIRQTFTNIIHRVFANNTVRIVMTIASFMASSWRIYIKTNIIVFFLMQIVQKTTSKLNFNLIAKAFLISKAYSVQCRQNLKVSIKAKKHFKRSRNH